MPQHQYRVLATVAAACTILTGLAATVSAAGAVPAQKRTPHGKVVVEAAGLPAGMSSRVRLLGPGRASEKVRIGSAPVSVSDLPTGRWRLKAKPVRTRKAIFKPEVRSTAFRVRQGRGTELVVRYDTRFRARVLGEARVRVQGIPGSTEVAGRVAGPLGFAADIRVSGENWQRLTRLPAGKYRASLTAVRVAGSQVPEPSVAAKGSFSFRVRPRKVSNVTEKVRLSAKYSGVVVDLSSHPVSGLPVCPIRAGLSGSESDRPSCDRTDPRGRFKVTLRVQPGVGGATLWRWVQVGRPDRALEWRTEVVSPFEQGAVPIKLRPRGHVTGSIRTVRGNPVPLLRICSVRGLSAPFFGVVWFDRDIARCSSTGSGGTYALRVDGYSQLFLDGVFATPEYAESMSAYLADDRNHLFQQEIRLPRLTGTFSATARPAAPWIVSDDQVVDITLADVVAGRPVTVTGDTPAARHPFCAMTLGDTDCGTTDRDGNFTVKLDTLVPPGSPTAEVPVKVVTGSRGQQWAPSVHRFMVVPGSSERQILQLPRKGRVLGTVPAGFQNSCFEPVGWGIDGRCSGFGSGNPVDMLLAPGEYRIAHEYVTPGRFGVTVTKWQTPTGLSDDESRADTIIVESRGTVRVPDLP